MNTNRRAGPKKCVNVTALFMDSNTALDAVAFQDHLVRTLALTSQVYPSRPAFRVNNTARKKNIRAAVDTGRCKLTLASQNVDEECEVEYVLGPKPPYPTLAQRRGLVSAPAKRLTEPEWLKVKGLSNCRDDSKHPCVICKEDFGTQKQVLLSCTHVFHQACLAAFERFSGKKSCPMCRKQSYETRMIHEGARYHRHLCATRIQAAWRGYIVYNWYKNLRETVPPKAPALKKKFYEKKLASITDRMVKSLDSRVNNFLLDVDRNLRESRRIFRQFDKAQQNITDEDWEGIQLTAVVRGEIDCAICLTALETRSTEACTRSATGSRKNRILLSCSHVFHQTCLQAFEEFSIDKANFMCPVCRTIYQKKEL